MDLDASDEQLDCPFVYASAKAGIAVLDLSERYRKRYEAICLRPSSNTSRLRKAIRRHRTQVLISTIDYNEYVGRIGVGKVDNGNDSMSIRMCSW